MVWTRKCLKFLICWMPLRDLASSAHLTMGSDEKRLKHALSLAALFISLHIRVTLVPELL